MSDTKEGNAVARRPPNAGKGRPKGIPNKTTTMLKDALLKAADQAHAEGLVGYLTQQAQNNPGPFMALLGKVLPLQVAGAGEGGSHLIRVVSGVPRDGD